MDRDFEELVALLQNAVNDNHEFRVVELTEDNTSRFYVRHVSGRGLKYLVEVLKEVKGK
jgi:hypothetical protein